MILTNIIRPLLGRQIRPFEFKKDLGFLPDMDVPNMGLYVHIPFCETICPFCPYYKVKYKQDDADLFLNALLMEIKLVAHKLGDLVKKRQATSLYFGGGSPALMIDKLPIIRRNLDKYFIIEGNAGIELHPRDIKEDTGNKLRDGGVDMVSLGIQSFNQDLLSNLGRTGIEPDRIFKPIAQKGFKAIDVDLIFGIPGQTGKDLRLDFIKAVELGATQISTYPFIDFSYANNKKKPQGSSGQKELLRILLDTATEMGFARTSVWTFGKKDAPQYSSITRDNFLGFGPSATSLGMDAFKANTFSLDAYIEAVNKSIVPTALKMEFNKRTRKLYWAFWNCYKGILSKEVYKELFSSELGEDFPFWLKFGEGIRLFQENEYGWKLTDRGSYYFHWLEQSYTHQYIDKTWRMSMETPWPEKILLY